AHARDVAQSLVGIAASVKLVESLPGEGVKDLSDFAAKFSDAKSCRKLLQALIDDTPTLTAADVAKWCKPGVAVPGVLASEVSPEKITWLWDNYIPFGKVTLFDGDPDEGKSLVTIDLAARLT